MTEKKCENKMIEDCSPECADCIFSRLVRICLRGDIKNEKGKKDCNEK